MEVAAFVANASARRKWAANSKQAVDDAQQSKSRKAVKIKGTTGSFGGNVRELGVSIRIAAPCVYVWICSVLVLP